MRLCYFFSFIILLFVSYSQAQEMKQPEVDVQLFIEKIFATQEQDVNYDDLYETLLQFYTNPIDLNKTNTEELRNLFILSELQLSSFSNYINKNGVLISVYELQAIPNFDLSTIENLLPFVSIGNVKNDTRPFMQRILQEDNNYLLVRYERTLENKKGYDSTQSRSPYVGDPNKVYMRFRTSRSNDFSFGFTAEKDAGETLIWDNTTHRYGMDFHSFHAQLMNKGRLKNVIVGDYQIQNGQGLILSSGFSIGKGSETITTVRRNQLGIRPYTSVIESNFFRGSAVTYQLGQLDVTGFYSNRLNDSSVQTDTLGTELETFFNSIQLTGMHRTTSEINNKQQVREQNIGGNIFYHSKNNNLQLGVTYLQTDYGTEYLRKSNYYNQFEFNGKFNFIYGFSGSYQWQNINLFGEVAQSKSTGVGAVGGILASLTHQIDLAVVLRHYDRNFHSFYGNAFGESTRNNNESGVYWGLKYKLNPKWMFSAYYDKFNFSWLRYQIKAPSEGAEYLVKLEYRPSRNTVLYFQFREEQKEKIISDDEAILQAIGSTKKQNYIFNIDYPSSDFITLKTRFQFSTYHFNNDYSTGYTILQDVSAAFNKFNFSIRYALFNTDNFDNRQYVYEKDVLYAFSIPAYSGIGSRMYLVMRYKFTKKVQLQGKYAFTKYRDRNSISSGNEQITGNVKQDVKLQLKISF